ncbi:hypothetical protein XELAEV_18025511mg [Xenopus laevis]|uniref:Sushi domain-containing protein n=1 Tax=Xenopus laevis TaxID=8355 RepID=A0A974D2H1_XENLA|nr:hypothetical protein XELAEV_18025511mg [Xenopus laevis]
MHLIGYLQVYIIALCCIAVGAQDACGRPDRTVEEELQGTWDKDSYDHGTIASYICRPGYSKFGAIKKQCSNGNWIYLARGQCKKKSCGHPGDIPNGSFELNGENEFVFGAIAEYFCDSGYQMVSKLTTRTCTANGWSNFLPNCEEKNCPPVEPKEGVEIMSSYDNEHTVGKVIRFQCKNQKFKLNGNSEIFCTSEGDWNAPLPECEEIKCRAPDLANGRINAQKETYYFDDKILYVCNDKYKKERSIDPVCTKNGWFPEPTCNEITCEADNVPNGVIKNKKNAYRLGETIELECNYAYTLYKPEEPRRCTVNGWSLPLTCNDKTCDRRPLHNGKYYRDSRFPGRKNSILWYTCNDNFDPVQGEYSYSTYYGKSKCTENGWHPLPECIVLCPRSAAQVESAEIYLRQQKYRAGDKVQFRCYGESRTEDGNIYGEIECLPNHKFSEARCLRSCIIESISHGNYIPKKSNFEYGESLVFECDEGYKNLKNTRFDSATCPWTLPRCVETSCRIAELNVNYNVGDVVQFSCSRGYKLAGKDTSQCYYYGWDPELPTCTDERGWKDRYKLITNKQVDHSVCAPAPKPQNSQDSESGNIIYHNGITVEIKCTPRFRPFGLKSIECQNGKWQTPPQCIELPHCSLPPKIEKGKAVPSKHWYDSGEMVNYQCDPGYDISGSSESWCFAERWTAPPVCKGKSCDQPPYVENTVIAEVKPQYKHGDIVKYFCQAGYTISENDQVKCIEGKWTNLPKCTSTSCESAPDITNALLLNKKDNYNSGERAIYRCNSGYVFDMNRDRAVCTNSQWKELPECRKQGQTCGFPPMVQFGDTLESREATNKHGTTLNYKCPEYYILEGNTQVVCRNGKWDDPPICIEPCTASERDMAANNIQLKWIKNAKLYSRHNEDIGFACLDGYEISNENLLRIKCDRSVLPYPRCTKKGSCLLIHTTMDENNIFVNGSTEIEDGKIVTFLCKEGWIPKDTLTRKCIKKNIAYPMCIRADPCEISSEKLRQHNLELDDPDNPTKTFYAHNEQITVKCKTGYYTSEGKDLKPECLNGKVRFPECTPGGNCTSPPTIGNGNVMIEAKDTKSFSSGTSLKVECNEGFAPFGPPIITCDNFAWTDVPRCNKQCQFSQQELEMNNLQLESSNDLNGIFAHGNLLNVQCKPGHIFKSKVALKGVCRNGNFVYPQCSPGSSCTISINDLGKNKIELLKPFDTNKEYPHETQFQFKCQNNYVLSPKKQLNAICNNGDVNYPRCYSRNRCQIYQEQMDENGLELDSKDEDSVYFEDGEQINFKCKAGLTISSGTVGICAKTQITYPRCNET